MDATHLPTSTRRDVALHSSPETGDEALGTGPRCSSINRPTFKLFTEARRPEPHLLAKGSGVFHPDL